MKAHYYLTGHHTSVCGRSTIYETELVGDVRESEVCKICLSKMTEVLKREFA